MSVSTTQATTMVQGNFSGCRIQVGGRRRREVPMLGSDKSTACRSVLVGF
ncbi:hypothetical protein Hanom_Chr09g00829061 [Helianthus anomalus]